MDTHAFDRRAHDLAAYRDRLGPARDAAAELARALSRPDISPAEAQTAAASALRVIVKLHDLAARLTE